jgi:flagellar biosynthetic protein FliQ
MSSLDVVQIGRELLMTALVLAMPAVLVSLAVGLIVSIFQTMTSIQEQTLNFVPRILAVGLVLIIALPWTLKVLVNFTYRVLSQMSEVGR